MSFTRKKHLIKLTVHFSFGKQPSHSIEILFGMQFRSKNILNGYSTKNRKYHQCGSPRKTIITIIGQSNKLCHYLVATFMFSNLEHNNGKPYTHYSLCYRTMEMKISVHSIEISHAV